MAAPLDLGIPGLTSATEIGTGGFATVYRAWQPAFRRAVAVKVLDIRPDAEGRARFERECQALGAVSAHPHIVGVHDAGFTAGGRPYLVLELLPGGSLQDRVDRVGPLPWDEATEIAVHLAGALETAHRAGVVHRDVKPGNVLNSAYGDPQLTDFGIARVVGAHETRSGVVTASMAHAAPEVLEGDRPSVAGDVYALASTTFELLAGRAPFARPGDESVLPLLRRIMDADVPDLRALGVPDAVAAAVEHGLAKDAADRHASAEVFGRALQDARRAHGLHPGRLVLARVDGGEHDGAGEPPSALVPPAAAMPSPPVDAAATVDVPSELRNQVVASDQPVATGASAAAVGPLERHDSGTATGNRTVALTDRPSSRPPLPPRHVPATVPPPHSFGGRSVRLVALAIAVVVVAAGIGWLAVARPGPLGTAATAPTTAPAPASPTGAPPTPGASPADGAAPAGGYDEVAAAFTGVCVANPANTEDYCRCVFDGIRATVPFDVFLERSRQGVDPRTDPVIGPAVAGCDARPR